MNSFNHCAYGSVFDWLFGVASGIRVEDDGAGYRHVSIVPHPDRRLGFVENSVETAGGVLASSWHYHGNELRYEIEIPEGTVADLTLPGQAVQRLSAGSYLFVKKRLKIYLSLFHRTHVKKAIDDAGVRDTPAVG